MKHQMPMGEQIKLPPTLAYMLGIDRAPRAAIDAMLDQAIAELDAIDGDPDIEPTGDELDGTGGEDDFCCHSYDGPGCPIADPDCGADDNCCDDDEMDLDEGYFDHPGFIPGGGSGMEGES